MIPEIRLGEPLISAEEIQVKVAELAEEVSRDFAPTGLPVSVIVVLKGACFFAIDLMKHLTVPTRIDFLQASSYSGMGSTGEVRLHSDIHMPVAGTNVLLVEDIVDTGLTATWLRRHMEGHHPASVKLCTLLDKPTGRQIEVDIDYTGFIIPDAFVLGYGLDYEEGYRNLPAVYVASPVYPDGS